MTIMTNTEENTTIDVEIVDAPKQSFKGQIGGWRPGGGRPKGSSPKITAKAILEQCEATVGKPFAETLVEGYRDSIDTGDTKLRFLYEKIILDKVASTLVETEVTDPSLSIDFKRKQFIEALGLGNNINSDIKE